MKELTAGGRGMQPVKKNNSPLILVKDDDERVYDGEIMEEDQIINRDREKTALVKKQETTTSPRRGFAFNLGKFTGSLIFSVGLLGKAINRFQSGKRSAGKSCKAAGGRGGGRGRRQRKGKRCSER